MLEYMTKGGMVMWVILGLGVAGMILILERLFHLHRARINYGDFLEGIYVVLRRNSVVEAISICEETPGPVAHLTRAAIIQREQSREDIKQAIEDAGLAEVPRLERGLFMLAAFAQATPVFGLLGTIIGLIRILQNIEMKTPIVHYGDLAGGMWQALLTTAFGFVAALILYIGYNLVINRIETIVLDMERASARILEFLTSKDYRHDRASP